MNNLVRNIIIGIVVVLLSVSGIFITYYLTVMRSDDNAIAVLINDGNEAMELSMYQEAIDKYNEAMEYEPESKELKEAIAHAYVMLAGTLGTVRRQ